MSSVTINRPDGVPGVTELVLDRPEALNAISTEHARAIVAATAEVAADPAVRVIVLSSSAERAFCVGADLKERKTIDDDGLRRQRLVFRAAFTGVLELPVPTVAAVHGHALGGGLELALGCDLIVADETAVLGLPEVTVGLVPGGGGTQLLPRRLGWNRAADLIFTGRRVDAAEAHRLGLVDRVVPAGQDRAAALELAASIAANSPVGVRNAKQAMRHGLDASLRSGLDIEDAAWRATAFSGDRNEGVAAFNEKRRPDWPGE
ncbi:enoyl-CoA hydratase/isomerase family protein [Jiangella asiatica]|uniref:enoyl-CoA hydratase n=1 Tax=Jiangella asiatica TaxID=2530372 RepID=A0A4R5DU32_9ACTN|nr:enoyl-CoA hydratase-related protein [Jiangella asiatica]TDE15820.1 enoyl-CoA hydratase [Jiangella asiatica]